MTDEAPDWLLCDEDEESELPLEVEPLAELPLDEEPLSELPLDEE